MGWLGNLWRDVTGVTAANTAAQAQREGTQASIDAMQQYLDPYASAGTDAVGQMSALSGAQGAAAQQAAFGAIENSPMFQSMVQQGENALLQNAAATGGLRGGNTAAALAQFRPQMLSQAIQQQYSQLGGLAGMGSNASSQLASGVGSAQQALGNIDASNAMSKYQLQRGFVGDLAGGAINLLGAAGGLPGIGSFLGSLGGGGGYNPGASPMMTTGVRTGVGGQTF